MTGLDAGYGRFKDAAELRYGEDASRSSWGIGRCRMYAQANDLMDGEAATGPYL